MQTIVKVFLVMLAINAVAEASWVAGENKFSEWSTEDMKKLMGTKLRKAGESPLPKKVFNEEFLSELPDEFDARQQWPSCIHPVLNQEQCGSCWAFGATEALSDRFCIQSNGAVSVTLSPQDLVSCDNTNMGCNGGYLDAAWQFMQNTGVVSLKCMPYTSGSGQNGQCPDRQCTGSGSWKPYHAKSVYDVSSSVETIQKEIMTNGPVEAAFSVYQDFMNYQSGVYVHKSGSLLGGHAIKILGWGVENGQKYWLVQNSWGTSWGIQGFFKILRGADECGIESNVVAGMASVSTHLPKSYIKEQEIVNTEDMPVLDDAIIEKVNSDRRATWKAERNERFEGVTVRDAKKLLGAVVPEEEQIYAPIVTLHSQNVPKSFDSRTKWPSCVHPIRNQEQCGSCWAFGASEALSDRFCVASNGTVNVVLSPENLVSCDSSNFGCQGGYLQKAWAYMANPGIVTDSCFPYNAGGGNAGPCRHTCANGQPWKVYQAEASSIVTLNDVNSISEAIMTDGPVEASFSVYQDFMSYRSGIYKHHTGNLLGGHAIKIIGWGEQNGQDYWIVYNSWGTTWGMNGIFWIAKGSNECGIESNVVCGQPKL